MFDKSKVEKFFNEQAKTWDAEMIKDDSIIKIILDNVGVGINADGLPCADEIKKQKILDVGCGTGVLIPYYLERGDIDIVAVDIAQSMIDIAKEKFAGTDVSFVCCDAETADVGRDYDAIVIYNAFPHFPNQEKLIEKLSGCLNVGGRLTVAHGMSRVKIDAHHSGIARDVSVGLMEANELAKVFSKYLKVTVVISNDSMYQVVGEKV